MELEQKMNDKNNLQISASPSPSFDQQYQGLAQQHLPKDYPIFSISKDFRLHPLHQKFANRVSCLGSDFWFYFYKNNFR